MTIINSLGVPLRPLAPESSWLFNWTTGETWAAPPPIPVSTFVEFERYTKQWNDVYGSYANTTYTESVPDDLTISTYDWLSRENYPQLQGRFTEALTAWGYGDTREIPIFYALRALSPAALAERIYLVDYHEVFQRYADQLVNATIHLGSRIGKIDRSESHATIHYSIHGDPNNPLSVQTCSDVIIAFPPTPESLHHAGLELSPAESTVFSAVRTVNYFSTAVKLNTPRLSAFAVATESPKISADMAGEPVLILSMYNTSDISLAYPMARHDQSVDEVRETTLQTLSRINRDPKLDEDNTDSTPVQETDIKTFRHHPDYFPHFSGEALRGGWYAKFNRLQGWNRTYYTSGLNRAEHVEYAVLAARELVEAHFST
ncbi:hypothetical protein BJX63DRAFT_430963 [Aspergillus granulosus]|uniref:Amine oxidase domain-containing protein n=1 Tax=Aspergillus granulosus TaxID=176169 RepID=A0ABR4HIB1_9EURO